MPGKISAVNAKYQNREWVCMTSMQSEEAEASASVHQDRTTLPLLHLKTISMYSVLKMQALRYTCIDMTS